MLVATKLPRMVALAPAAKICVRCDLCKETTTQPSIRHLPIQHGHRWYHTERGWLQPHGGPDVCPKCAANE